MNSKIFAVLFLHAAVCLTFSEAIFFGTGAGITTVALNGATTIPLVSATAGTLATPLAVLGVLKLGAAALLALTLLGGQEEEEYAPSGYGKFRRRHRRDAAEAQAIATNPDAVFGLAALVDTYGCGKQLICELEAASAVRELEEDEKLMTIFFKYVSIFLLHKMFKSITFLYSRLLGRATSSTPRPPRASTTSPPSSALPPRTSCFAGPATPPAPTPPPR